MAVVKQKSLLVGKLLWLSLWILLFIGIAYDIVWNHFVNPIGVLMVSILVVGTVVSKLRKWPILTTQGWQSRLAVTGVLILLVCAYIIATMKGLLH